VTGGVVLTPDAFDNIILEPSDGGHPAVNARQGIALMFVSAPAGVIAGVNTGGPITVYNPAGTVPRLTITGDPVGNRTNTVINNMP